MNCRLAAGFWGLLLMTGSVWGQALSSSSGKKAVRMQRQVILMGTRCTLTTEALDRARGRDRLEALLSVLEQTEAQLSTWRSDSRLTLFNKTPVGTPFQLSQPLCRLFEDLYRWHRRTRGAFDPAIGVLIQAWGLRQGGRFPSPKELGQAMGRIGLKHLPFDPVACQAVRRRAVTLDAGAFGKGEALDRARRLSLNGGMRPWMINLGGQIMVEGTPAGASGWPVDVAHPDDRQQAAMRMLLSGGSLAVSGGSERDLKVQGRRVGHILDPRTGRPADYSGSVVVWHPSALAADILSTALFVMGEREGMEWADNRDLAACFLTLSPTGTMVKNCSDAFRRRFP